MDITYMGHSAFRLRGKEATIVTDPFPPTLGLPLGKPAADIVTVSHRSPNHSYVQGIEGRPRTVQGPGEYEIGGVLIAGVATARKPKTGPLNTAYVFRFDDLTVCHLGDINAPLSDDQVEDLGNIDVLFVPVGAGNALGPAAAAEVVAQLSPALIVPMHYGVAQVPSPSLEGVGAFCREMGLKEWTPEQKITVSRGSLPSEPKVVVLEPRHA